MNNPEVGLERLEHPLRRRLHEELHARPSLYFEGDTDVWHLAVLMDETVLKSAPGLQELTAAAGLPECNHGIVQFGSGKLKWERHTEFLSLTHTASASQSPEPPEQFLALARGTRGQTIAAIRVVVRQEREGMELPRPGADFIVSTVGGGDAEVHSNFKLNEAGFLEFEFFNKRLNAYRAGRMVRRLLEIETYRMMALLATPVARQTADQLRSFDKRLGSIVEHMQRASKVDKALLGEVTKLSSDVIEFSALARHRFSATKAYAGLVSGRLQELREERVPQRQRLGTFIDRRFRPAIRSFEAAQQRLDDLANRVSLAGDLLRTTVQVQLEDQNASLLASVEERTRAQVHIQQAVEGLSVIAITYYAVSLAKVGADAAVELGANAHLAKGAFFLSAPLLAAAVWLAVRRVHAKVSASSRV